MLYIHTANSENVSLRARHVDKILDDALYWTLYRIDRIQTLWCRRCVWLFVIAQTFYRTKSCFAQITVKLRMHQLRVHGAARFHCTECSFKSTTMQMLTGHKLWKHTDPEHMLMHECRTCGRVFKILQELKIHIRSVHEKVRPFVCEHCPKRFPSSSNLKRHIKAIHLT